MVSNVLEQQKQKRNATTAAQRQVRRRYFINKPFQLAFAGNMVLIAAFTVAVTTAVVSWIFIYVLNERLSGNLIDGPYLIKISIILLLLASGIVFWTIHRTHAIAGPIDKTRRILRDAAEGRFPDNPVAFRKGDAFMGLADDLNQCLAAMQANNRRTEKTADTTCILSERNKK